MSEQNSRKRKAELQHEFKKSVRKKYDNVISKIGKRSQALYDDHLQFITQNFHIVFVPEFQNAFPREKIADEVCKALAQRGDDACANVTFEFDAKDFAPQLTSLLKDNLKGNFNHKAFNTASEDFFRRLWSKTFAPRSLIDSIKTMIWSDICEDVDIAKCGFDLTHKVGGSKKFKFETILRCERLLAEKSEIESEE